MSPILIAVLLGVVVGGCAGVILGVALAVGHATRRLRQGQADISRLPVRGRVPTRVMNGRGRWR